MSALMDTTIAWQAHSGDGQTQGHSGTYVGRKKASKFLLGAQAYAEGKMSQPHHYTELGYLWFASRSMRFMFCEETAVILKVKNSAGVAPTTLKLIDLNRVPAPLS